MLLLQQDETLAQILTRLRTEKGLSQRQLAIESGVDRGYINRIEKGTYTNITFNIARALAKVLGVSPKVFLGPDCDTSLAVTVPSAEKFLEDARKYMPAIVPLYSEASFKVPNNPQPIQLLFYNPAMVGNRKMIAYRTDRKYVLHDPERTIEKDQTLLIDETIEPTPNNIIFFQVGNERTVGRLQKRNGGLVIKSQNGDTTIQECNIFARVIQIIEDV